MAVPERNAGWETETADRKAFEEALRSQPHGHYPVTMKAGWIETPLGSMLGAGNDDRLYMLVFMEPATTERKVAQIQKRLKACLEMGESEAIISIRREVAAYFAGEGRDFCTPVRMTGTAFQILVWEELRRVPYAGAISYTELAERIGKPAAFRAVASANALNLFHILAPCHRIINSDGGLGGYAAGLHRKKWLLDFEHAQVMRSGKP